MSTSLFPHPDLAPESRWNVFSATPGAKEALLYPLEAGDLLAGPHYRARRESRDAYLIYMTVDGCGQLEWGGQTHLLPPGHFFFTGGTHPPDCATAPEAENWHALWVLFQGTSAKFYNDAFLTHNDGSPLGIFPVPAKALSIFSALLDLDTAGRSQLMADFQGANLLTQLLSECVLSTVTKDRTGDVPQIIQHVRLHLLNSFQKKHTLEQLGTQFNINPYYLQKQFKRHVGMSPSEYLIFLRLTKAKELLRSTKLPVGEIAYAVGIENLGFFTRQFKQHEGMTPQEYRKL